MANRYWVWGTGNWDASTTTHWSTSSGGAGGASVPTSADNVIFDSLSNATAYTVTITATANCADLTIGNPLAGAITLAGSSDLNIYGSLSLVSWMTNSHLGTITFAATSTGKTIACNSTRITAGWNIVFNWVGWGWTLSDNFGTVNTGNLTVTNGNLNTNGKTVICSAFLSNNTNTRTITFGATSLTCNSFNIWTVTNLTFNANTSTLNVASTFSGGGLTYNVVNLTSASQTVNQSNTFATLTYTGTAAKTNSLSFWGNQTVTGTLTINGNSSINRILVKSDTLGTARTITAATVSVSNADFQDITGAGAGSWNLSAITGLSWDCGGNSGITFTTPATTDCSAGTTWSTATWSSRVPLPQDTATFSGASRTITQDMPRIGSVNFTGSSGLTWTTSTAASVYGSINLTDLGTLTASTQTYTFAGRWSNTLTSAGKTWSKELAIACFSGTVTLGDTLTMWASSPLTLSSGTFTTNNNNITTADSINATFNATVNLGSSTIDLTSGGSSTWAFSAGTLNAGTSTIKFSWALITNKTFTGGSKTYNNFWNATTGAFAITIAGSNTFNQFKVNAWRTQQFTAGTTQTIADPVFTGTLGNVITIGSATAASHTLTKSGGGTVTANYCSISRSTATPASTWYATNSTNGGNNSGWGFIIAPLDLSQTITLASSMARGFFSTLAQTVSVVSSIGNFEIGKVVSQTITLASSLAKESARSVSETITVSANAVKDTFVAFIENVIISHTSEFLKTVFATLSEILTVSESVAKSSARSLAETVQIAWTFAKTALKSISETISVSDSITRAMERIYSETVALSESAFKSASRSISETVSMADAIAKEAWKLLSEAVTVAGSMGSRAITRAFSETVTLVMAARKLLNGLTEGLWTRTAAASSEYWNKIAKVSDVWTKTPKE